MSKRNEEIIKLVKSQTDYDEKTIIEKLKEHNGNYIFVIKEYLNPNFKEKSIKNENISLNQKMMKGYRDFLDDAYCKYQKRKEIEDKINDYIENKKNQNEVVNEVVNENKN